MHALADGTHDGGSYLGVVEDLRPGELVVGDGHLGPDIFEVVGLEDEG